MRARAGWAVMLFMVAVAGIARTQPRLAMAAHTVKERDDVYALPPPAHLRAAVLGWDAAAVDLIWAKLLVDYGTHWSEHREFRVVPQYADAILALEPTHAAFYRYVDTMLVYRPLQGTEQDARLARAYLERGTRELPQDSSVWMELGQFEAFIGPSFLRDDREREAWRKDGAAAIEHAVELGGDADRALTAAALLTQAGANAEAIRYLERAYAFTEHPSMLDIHEAIGRKLAALEAIAQRDRADTVLHAIDTKWQSEMPFVSRDHYLLMGPGADPARCAGAAASGDKACSRSWDAVIEGPGSSEGSP
jgi:hypothetical protein